jgi:hydrogenase expression/formation protein HypC
MCLAVPGKVVSITGDDPIGRTGKVDFSGVVREVSLACVPEVKIGDYVMVHVGMAIGVVDETEAREVFEYLTRIGELASEETGA